MKDEDTVIIVQYILFLFFLLIKILALKSSMGFLRCIKKKPKLDITIESITSCSWQKQGVKWPPMDRYPSASYMLPSRNYIEIGPYYGQAP